MPLNESVSREQPQLQQSLRDRVEGAGDVYVERKVLRLAAVSVRCDVIEATLPHAFSPRSGHAWRFPIDSVSSKFVPCPCFF